jgi:type I restriction enzyme S subunit
MSEALEQSDLREGYKEVQFGPKTLVVPSDWSTERFGDVFHRRQESVDDIDDETIKYVGLKHLDSGQLKINGYDDDGRERSSSRVFHEGDILFGKLRPNLNKAAIAPFSGVCSSDIIPIYAGEDAHQEFLPYLMHSKLVRDRAVSTMEGTNLPRTSWGDIEKTLVPLPPLSEQRRIAEILSTVDEYLEETIQMIDIQKELRKGFLQDALSQSLNESAMKMIEVPISPRKWALPKRWEVKTVSEITTKITDGVHQTPDYVEDGVPFLKAGDLRKDSYNWKKFPQISQEAFNSQQFTAKRGDLLLAKNGSPKTIGVTKVVDWDVNFSFFVSICLLRPNTDRTTAKYLQAALMSEMAKNQMTNMSQTGTVTNLHLEEIRSISIPIPPLIEQKEIVERLKKIEDRISQEKETKDQLEDLKRGLMQDLLTGKVRVDTD